MRFSQRIGKTSVREILQNESIDKILENRLWNTFLVDFFNAIDDTFRVTRESRQKEVCTKIWTDFFNSRIDEIPSFTGGGIYIGGVLNKLKEWYFQSKWYEKYDFVEFIANIDLDDFGTSFSRNCNEVLEKEMSAYRLVDDQIVPISSEEELTELFEVVESSSNWSSVQTHIKSAIHYFSNRDKPDYRNSIKESISAVEALCVIITGDKDASLGQALKQIEENYEIHKALKKAFSSLYGYTSDTGGIRHKLLEDDIEVSFEDAKFMLVSCSAFINYLKVKINT